MGVSALRWVGGALLVLGGDFNIRGFTLDEFEFGGVHEVDFVFACGLRSAASSQVLERGWLFDHVVVLVELTTDSALVR